MIRNATLAILAAAFAGTLALAPAAHAQVKPATKTRDTPTHQDPLAKDSKGKGRMTFDFSTKDFGLQPNGKELKVSFPFINTGEETLRIVSTRTSCGCTTAVLADKEFEPGEGSQIDVTYKPKGASRQTKTITVVTDSALTPTITLNVTAQVVQIVDVNPGTVQFGEVLVGTGKDLYVNVFAKDPELAIKSIEVNGNDRITAEVIDEIPQEVRKGFDGKRRIKINLPDDLEIGRVHATLKITSLAAFAEGENPNVQEEHISNVSVLGRVVGNLQASPSAIRMLPLKPGEEFTYSTKISHRGNREFVVTNDDITLLRSSIPGVEATIEPYEEDGESGYVFTIKGKSGNHRGAFRGTYAIKSDIEGEPPLRLNFSGTVRAR